MSPWISPSEAARMLGESEEVVREKIKSGVIRGGNIALPGHRPRYATTEEGIEEYQARVMGGVVPKPAKHSPIPQPIPTGGPSSYRALREQRRQQSYRKAP